jgi:hypothetical protein
LAQHNDCSPAWANDFQTILRWMRENVLAVSSIVAGGDEVTIHERIKLNDGVLDGDPADWCLAEGKKWMVNSASCLIVCCYIDALGKVIVDAGAQRRSNQFRFGKFFDDYVRTADPDLSKEPLDQEVRTRDNIRVGNVSQSAKTLFTHYRHGFVHGFASEGKAWGRCSSKQLWVEADANVTVLNINHLVELFVAGLDKFERSGVAPEVWARRFDSLSDRRSPL